MEGGNREVLKQVDRVSDQRNVEVSERRQIDGDAHRVLATGRIGTKRHDARTQIGVQIVGRDDWSPLIA